MKKFAAILACVYLAAHLSACTSNESREDETIAAAEETEFVDGELEKVEAGDEANAGFVDEQLPEQALGEEPTVDSGTAIAEEAPPAEAGMDTGAAPDALADSTAPTQAPGELSFDAAATEVPAAESFPEPAPDTSMASSEATAAVDPGTSASETTTATAEPRPSAPAAELQKIPTAPYRTGGQLLNAVYVARPGDNYKKIATMLFGDESKRKDLKKGNPRIKSPKPGSKIFYNSPQRPTDEVAMKTYYEDMGMQPEVYVAQEGDNIRKISKQLLGYDNAWKEIWTTNLGVESKSDLIAGTELKYWKGAPAAAAPEPVLAQNTDVAPVQELNSPPQELPPPPTPEQLPPAQDLAQNLPPPNDFPPSPDMNTAGTTTAMNDLPPPPPPEMAPPPPPPMEQAPPPPAMQKPAKPMLAEEGGMSNDDMMMGLAGVGIVAAGISAIMVIRKRRQQKELHAAFGDTQIGAS
ncbi:MAG: hypothetical protein ACK5P7_07755 [Bdellovibrio sp.]